MPPALKYSGLCFKKCKSTLTVSFSCTIFGRLASCTSCMPTDDNVGSSSLKKDSAFHSGSCTDSRIYYWIYPVFFIFLNVHCAAPQLYNYLTVHFWACISINLYQLSASHPLSWFVFQGHLLINCLSKVLCTIVYTYLQQISLIVASKVRDVSVCTQLKSTLCQLKILIPVCVEQFVHWCD